MGMKFMDVVWTALVTIAALSTCVLVYIAADPGWGIREYSPILQAVLSAGAIFSAWLLQDMKRKADRAEAVRDNIEAISQLMGIVERAIARALSMQDREHIEASFASLIATSADNALLMLRQQKAALLPTDIAVRAYISATNHMAYISTLIGDPEKFSDEQNAGPISRKRLGLLYNSIRDLRTAFIRETGGISEDQRPPRELEQLKAWRERTDAWWTEVMSS